MKQILIFAIILVSINCFSQKHPGIKFSSAKSGVKAPPSKGDSLWLQIKSNPITADSKIDIITIPVVIFNIWHDSTDYLDDELLKQQIDELNDCFRCKNKDRLKPNHPFYKHQADSKIEFKLIHVERINTDSVVYHNPYNIIRRAYIGVYGGKGYLRVFVGNCNGLNASCSPYNEDLWAIPTGIYLDFKSVRNLTQRRILVHEVGHWLGLYHTFGESGTNLTDTGMGDFGCGNDYIDDTPPQTYPSYRCPKFPHDANNVCGSDSNGVMFMNYMDYTDQFYTVMFTWGQVTRMRAVLNTYRKELLFVK